MASLADTLQTLADALLPGPGTVHLSGGVVRDLLLRRAPRDVDLLVEGGAQAEAFTLSALERISGMTPVIFDRRPPATYRVLLDGLMVDTSFCPPDGVAVAMGRRDFRVNAMALPLRAALAAARRMDRAHGDAVKALKPLLVDPSGGLQDLEARRLQEVSSRSLREDPLRLLRAIRLAATLEGFTLSGELQARIRRQAPRVNEPAAERTGAEMNLIMESPRVSWAVEEMDRLDLLDRILPEMAPLRDLEQPPLYHDHDVRQHSLRAVGEAQRLAGGENPLGLPQLQGEARIIFLWATLLHDTGKAASATRDERGVPHFYGHEEISASLAFAALTRLRIARRIIEPVTDLIRWHLRTGSLASMPEVKERPIRRLVRQAGERLELLLLLALADRRAAGGSRAAEREEALRLLCLRALALKDEVAAAAAAPPLLDGREVMEILGLGPGPRVGSILRWIERLRAEKRLERREEAVALLQTLPPSRIPD